MMDKQGYMHARTCTRPRAWAPARTHTQKQICNTYCFSTATMDSRTRLMFMFIHTLTTLLFLSLYMFVMATIILRKVIDPLTFRQLTLMYIKRTDSVRTSLGTQHASIGETN